MAIQVRPLSAEEIREADAMILLLGLSEVHPRTEVVVIALAKRVLALEALVETLAGPERVEQARAALDARLRLSEEKRKGG
jgi:hypothetical protein